MATIREVSKHANVSVATVSRVVNGNKWVSDSTREKVLAAMKELGYQPNSFAKALATNKSDTVGMVVSDLGGPFFGDMMRAAEDEVRKLGKHLIITSGHDTLDSEQDAIEFLMQRRVDALLLHLDSIPDEDIIKLSDTANIPIILMNRLIPELPDQCISLDNDMGGYLATQHLIELGHTNIACITGPLFKADARSRLAGYRRAIEQAGMEYDERLVIESDYQEAGGKASIERLRRRNMRFTGVVAQNDHMAIGAMNALKMHGLSVPDDVSVVGYDDMVMARYTEPGLTTVNIPVAQFGQQAANLALSRLGEKTGKIFQHFQPELVVRGSSGPAPK
ncbi:LacI family DNA-binding transcriptional regulator [Reinekea sp. G2M2-21]|jgi:LacI family transcriptional regulator|uniref:LacI family DNA-binding transcriptional regulator n=1 Tax=Reinekea sp. G2M2-21 TaxID=2788942 RepID=UPI0018A9FAD3|nr:LacI family DNA-binding transcriptional regulator [Reinekea sp. G2M2-21]MDX1342408.1 LacI family DNA-binding transcriptional regulator [Reinekea sp.]MDX1472800.1 LacI family DNA-binding transcriptional regulator [Reinekea sp.]